MSATQGATDQFGGHKSLAEALAAFQAALPNVGKDKTAQVRSDKGNYSYKYADLADVVKAGHPLLSAHGLSFSSRPTLNDDGVFVLAYTLRHVSGESESGEYPLPASGTPQALGAAQTYARRYVFCAMTGIVADEDNDAHDGGNDPTGYQRQARPRQAEQQRPDAQRRAASSNEDTPHAARTVVENRAKAMGVEYATIAAEYQRRTGTALDDETRAEWIRKFIAGLDSGTVKVGQPDPAGVS